MLAYSNDITITLETRLHTSVNISLRFSFLKFILLNKYLYNAIKYLEWYYFTPITKRWGCWALKSRHITGDSVGQIHSGYDGFFKLNKQTVPFVIGLLNDTRIHIL